MSDDQFKALCNTYGFAPSRALRELIDCVRAQEIEACAKECEREAERWEGDDGPISTEARLCAIAIRARKENT